MKNDHKDNICIIYTVGLKCKVDLAGLVTPNNEGDLDIFLWDTLKTKTTMYNQNCKCFYKVINFYFGNVSGSNLFNTYKV